MVPKCYLHYKSLSFKKKLKVYWLFKYIIKVIYRQIKHVGKKYINI